MTASDNKLPSSEALPITPCRWQFTLGDLLVFTTAVAATAAMTRWFGWGVLLIIINPLMLVVYVAFWVELQQRRWLRTLAQQRNDEAQRSENNAAADRG